MMEQTQRSSGLKLPDTNFKRIVKKMESKKENFSKELQTIKNKKSLMTFFNGNSRAGET